MWLDKTWLHGIGANIHTAFILHALPPPPAYDMVSSFKQHMKNNVCILEYVNASSCMRLFSSICAGAVP